MTRSILILISITLLAIVVAAPPDANPAFRDLNGKVIHPLTTAGHAATLFIFIAHDCPVSNSYAPEINRITAHYAAKKVAAFLVYADADYSATEARKHWADYHYLAPAIFDSGFV